METLMAQGEINLSGGRVYIAHNPYYYIYMDHEITSENN